MLLNPACNFPEALAHVQEELLRQENHAGTWIQLNQTQKTLVRMLAIEAALKPFSAETVAELRRRIGINTLQKTHIQKAMAKLAEAGIVDKGLSSLYEFENPSLRDWVRTLAS